MPYNFDKTKTQKKSEQFTYKHTLLCINVTFYLFISFCNFQYTLELSKYIFIDIQSTNIYFVQNVNSYGVEPFSVMIIKNKRNHSRSKFESPNNHY